MPAAEIAVRGRLLLVSAPWPLFNRPSLPLGALKAYLSVHLPQVHVDACHLFLKVAHTLGYDRYQQVSRRTWRAESVFSALLYPEHAQYAEALYARTLKRGDDAPSDFHRLAREVKTATDEWLETIDWQALDLVGFSVSFCQVTASLYLISRIKTLCPTLPVVVGGSSFSGERSADLLKVFPSIDYLVTGEGERPLTDLLRFLLSPHQRRQDKADLPGAIATTHSRQREGDRFCQLKHLDCLPVPDYDEYFSLLAGFSADQRIFPVLPVEASRGCWWRRKDRLDQFNGCAFCNLNLQWKGYRVKTSQQVIGEVKHLVQRHQVLSFSFSDNAFPPHRANPIFDGFQRLGKDLSIFTELRATTTPALLGKMRGAGVETVQVGIEALSTRLLSKMNKGVRAIDNLHMMKQCETTGIVNASNLLLHFPSSDAEDVQETLRTMDFAWWYRPLKTVGFWLGVGSPVHRLGRRFNIRATYNHPNLKKIFPEPIAGGIRFIIQGYRGDRKRQQRLWRPVEAKARRWRTDYIRMRCKTDGGPSFTVRDGGRFLIIDQHFPDRPTSKHRLTGISADIYRFCHIPRNLDDVAAAFASHRPEAIRLFLRSLVDKRLMYGEGECYLSLAIPVRWNQ
jgi:ribosomal peptide maturation radical SAM protein 1